MKQIIAFSGSHGTGKTTAAYNHAQHLKFYNNNKSIHALCDLEAFCPWPFNKETTEQTQTWMFGNQIQQELMALNRFDVVVTDRTIIDVVAYTHVAGFVALAQGMLAYAEQHLVYYYEIRFKKIANNEHCYPDGIRETTDRKFRQDVENAMIDFYSRLKTDGVFPGHIYYA